MSVIHPVVSVILCNYNYGRFVAEAIDSVLCQTCSDFELIIVDDGSTDNSRKVIASYEDPRIQITLQENSGQASAFNAGFEKANGEFIAFLDSDDFWKPEKLATVIKVFEQGNFSVVQHNLEVIDRNSRPTGKLHPRMIPGVRNVVKAYFTENHTGFFSATSGIVCRRIDLENVFPLDESWRICADVALTRPLPMFGEVFTLKKALGYYRIHGSNRWMGIERPRERMESETRYIAYTNRWLARKGYTEQIDFTRSAIYKIWEAKQYPWYHPLRSMKMMAAIGRINNPLGILLQQIYRKIL